MTQTSEEQSQTGQPESTAPTKKSSRKSILAFAVFALGINSTAAYYTLSPPDVALHDLSKLAELIPHELLPQWKASDPISDPAVAALKNIQAGQQQCRETEDRHKDRRSSSAGFNDACFSKKERRG